LVKLQLVFLRVLLLKHWLAVLGDEGIHFGDIFEFGVGREFDVWRKGVDDRYTTMEASGSLKARQLLVPEVNNARITSARDGQWTGHHSKDNFTSTPISLP
jgi:hypothetical protein